jgi:hypothetical protein
MLSPGGSLASARGWQSSWLWKDLRAGVQLLTCILSQYGGEMLHRSRDGFFGHRVAAGHFEGGPEKGRSRFE